GGGGGGGVGGGGGAGAAGGGGGQADRNPPGRRPAVAVRPRRVSLPQPAFTASVMPMPGADARPRRGDWAMMRAEPGASLDDTVTSSFSGFSLTLAWASVSPTTLGTTPCSAFERTSVTRSPEDRWPRAGYCLTTTPTRCRGPAGR